MKSTDGRRLKHDLLEALRIRAVKQVESGECPEDVIKALGMSRGCIYKWIARYKEGGEEALKAKPLNGRPLKLNDDQIRWIYQTVTMKNPLQLNFPFALWTRKIIKELIEKEFDIKISITSVGRLFKKLGLNSKKPLVKAFTQNPVLLQEWSDKVNPDIKKQAKQEGADILFVDENEIKSDTTFPVEGLTPVLATTVSGINLNIISAISTRGAMRFMACRGKVNDTVFCEFLKRLMHKSKGKIFLILNDHPVFRSAKVKKFVESTDDKLRLLFLPSFSHSLSQDEIASDRKLNLSIIEKPDEFNRNVMQYLKSLQSNPEKVRTLFKELSFIRYTAQLCILTYEFFHTMKYFQVKINTKKFLIPTLTIIMAFIVYISFVILKDDDIIKNISLSSRSHMEDVTIINKSKNTTKWSATVKKVLFADDENSADLKNVTLYFNEKDISLNSDSGIYDFKNSKIDLYGKVTALEKDYKLKSDKLSWDIKNEIMDIDSEVRIDGQNFTIRADSMESAEKGKVKFSGNVKATFR